MAVKKYIIGIDEVGRGPLAGRIFVGAVILSEELNKKLEACMKFRKFGTLKSRHLPLTAKLTDSKKLTQKQREDWFAWIKENNIPFSTSAVSPSIIDRINISGACNKAANSVVRKLIAKHGIKNVRIIADAGISIRFPEGADFFESFPKADETVPAVSLASIVAKVTRDKEMLKIGKKYPDYGFDGHKGYGTKKHIAAIKKYGPSPIHRLTFIGNIGLKKV